MPSVWQRVGDGFRRAEVVPIPHPSQNDCEEWGMPPRIS